MESIHPTQVFQDLDTPVSTLDNITQPSLAMTAEEEIIFNAGGKGSWVANESFVCSVFPSMQSSDNSVTTVYRRGL